MEMDAMRIFQAILVTLMIFSIVPTQAADESTKTEALALKAQTIELEGLKTEIKAQGEKIDRLTQEVTALSEMLKQKPPPAVAKAEPVQAASPPTPNPPAANPAAANPAVANPPAAATAGVENPGRQCEYQDAHCGKRRNINSDLEAVWRIGRRD
jgi:hypothetical protein